MRRRVRGLLLATILTGCAGLGQLLQELVTERPPLPLDGIVVASDARLDSSGAIAGSFVGEGTYRQVHLLSTDTGLVAALARRYRPERDRRGTTWEWLAARQVVRINPDRRTDSALVSQTMLVGSPDGHTPVRLRSILLHGSACGWRGTQAELVVEPQRGGGPALRGPVVGALLAPEDGLSGTSPGYREPPPEPDASLTDSLLSWSAQTMDSLLARTLSSRDLPLTPARLDRLSLNTLVDDDAADVLSFRADAQRTRYAVSLRLRRFTARDVAVLTAIVVIWDATGSWRQVVFRPTVLEYRRGLPARALTGTERPWFWRRLDAVSGFDPGRDYLWMEQVDVQDQSVTWVILEPRGNIPVAAAEVAGPCRY